MLIKYEILISGAGQLGSRYLQGLAKCRLPLIIYVHDIHHDSLSRARKLWNEAIELGTHHEASFHTTFDSLQRELDVAIVATTANARPQLVEEITRHSSVRYWILEKVLAQSEVGVDELVRCTERSDGRWINTPRRIMPWYQQINSQLGLKRPMTLKVDGGQWGLACNAVHFLDLLAWWTDENLEEIDTAHLEPQFFESKRPGNWEIFGALESKFSGGSKVTLRDHGGSGSTLITLTDGHLSWLIDEAEGVARRSDGKEIVGQVVYQSVLTPTLVDCILENGACDLPELKNAAMLHRVFINAMLRHWRQAGHPDATFVPIT